MVVLQINSKVMDLIDTYLQIKFHVFCGNKPAMLEEYRKLILEEMIICL